MNVLPSSASTPVHPRQAWRTVAVFSAGIAAQPALRSFLGAEKLALFPTDRDADGLDAVVGWGEKDNTQAAKAFAQTHDLPYLRLEDGFLRSVGLSGPREPGLSLIIDDLGIYYDATRPSRLESWLADLERQWDTAARARARSAIEAIRRHRLSKYNHTPPGLTLGPSRRNKRVLVVDQTAGDMSVRRGGVAEGGFSAMLAAALSEHPDAEIIIKTHPDVIAGKKRGYLTDLPEDARIVLVGDPINPITLLEQVDHVYVATSQLGFEALLVGKTVTCFGMPFYAGWGLTDDRVPTPRRGVHRTLEEVFAAAYIDYVRYLDPETGARCEIEDIIDFLARQRAQFERNQGTIFCFGFRFWKRNYIRAYLRCPGNRVLFARDARHAKRLGFDRSSKLLVWGLKDPPDVRKLAEDHGVTIWRMEDGFLRSVGLGSDLVAPASLVVDRQGIYYDPTHASELESILQTAVFEASELSRARALREMIVTAGVSKYNVGDRTVALERPAGATRVILVPGQVEDDASIQLGCRDIRTNLGLLQAVRESCPDAYVIWKPHPDVTSGNRKGAVAEDEARRFADRIITDVPLAACLSLADEVHTMTSLVGFEALTRGLVVAVYGQPFYSGWGLTRDRYPLTRRSRRLTLDELVAGTLLRYPRYLSRRTGRFSTPELVVTQLREQIARGNTSVKATWLTRQMRKVVYAAQGMFEPL